MTGSYWLLLWEPVSIVSDELDSEEMNDPQQSRLWQTQRSLCVWLVLPNGSLPFSFSTMQCMQRGPCQMQALCSLDFLATSSVGHISPLCISKLLVSHSNTEQTNAAPLPYPPAVSCDPGPPSLQLAIFAPALSRPDSAGCCVAGFVCLCFSACGQMKDLSRIACQRWKGHGTQATLD